MEVGARGEPPSALTRASPHAPGAAAPRAVQNRPVPPPMRAIASLSRASFMFSCARATGTGADQDDKLDPSKTKKLCELQNLRTGMLPRTAPQRSRAMRTQTHGCLAESCVLRAACCCCCCAAAKAPISTSSIGHDGIRTHGPRFENEHQYPSVTAWHAPSRFVN
jgi:hypothetical protein